MNRYSMYISLVALLFGSAFAAPVAFAQIYGKPAPLSASIVPTPSLPGPFEGVTLKYTTYSMDSSRATISWYVDGQLKAQGVGLTVYKTVTGPSGSHTVIQAKGESAGAPALLATLELRPAYVGIIWEAQTYTPPFYQGKALRSPGASIRYVAVPLFIDQTGARVDASKLMYKWALNNRPLPEISGLGKRAVVLANDKYARIPEVSVEVSTFDGKIKTSAKTKVASVQPFATLYLVHPLLGVEYENALGTAYDLSSAEFTVLSEPYFYSVKRRDDTALSYEWQLNGTHVSSDPMVTMRPQGESAGTARVDILVRHLRELMQSTRSTFTVRFNTPKSQDDPVTPGAPSTYDAF